MFGISAEHFLVLGIVLVIFGPRRLPELGNTLGKAIRNFKDAISGVEEADFRKIENQKTIASVGPTKEAETKPQPSLPLTQTASEWAFDEPGNPNSMRKTQSRSNPPLSSDLAPEQKAKATESPKQAGRRPKKTSKADSPLVT